MRKHFAQLITKKMESNLNLYVLTGDLGYGVWDEAKRNFPNRFINIGAAEQSMLGISVGLALEGKIPIVYSITPFLLYRPFETIRNYIDGEKIAVTLVGAGRDKEYTENGPSHWATDDHSLLQCLPNIQAYWPETNSQITNIVDEVLSTPKPYYINLRR